LCVRRGQCYEGHVVLAGSCRGAAFDEVVAARDRRFARSGKVH